MIIKAEYGPSWYVDVDAIAAIETSGSMSVAEGDLVNVHLRGGTVVMVPWRKKWWEQWLHARGPVVA